MTTRLHGADGYRVEFPARVIHVATDHLVLDRTHFFGPHDLFASDIGSIDGHRVCGLRRSRDAVLEHVLLDAIDRRQATSPSVGDLVDCVIDWQHRYAVMKLHTVQHLVELGARATHDVSDVTLGPVTSSSADMVIDFAKPGVDCPAILHWLDEVIEDDLSCAVSIAASPPFDQVWHLDGFGHHRCDALHLASTSEVDDVSLSSRQLEPTRLVVTLQVDSKNHVAEPGGSSTLITTGEHRGRYRLGQGRRQVR